MPRPSPRNAVLRPASTRITPAVLADLRRLAVAEGVTLSALVRQLLGAALTDCPSS